MHAWSGRGGDIMGPTVTRTGSTKPNTPPLKNGSDLRESGYLIAVGSRTARFRRKHKDKMLLIILLFILLLVLCLAIVMTVLYVKQKRHKPARVCETRECLRSAANLALSIDKTADPCHDFYQYACGNWAEDHPRPDAYRSYDWFRDKQSKVYTVVRDFLTRNITRLPKPVQQAKDMYAACMDTETLDKLGLKPVLEILESLSLPPVPTYVNATDDFDYDTYNFDWIEAVIKVKTQLRMDVLIGFDIFTDPRNSSIYRLVMGSPETTNPFPSTHNENKRNNHKNRKSFKYSTKEIEETIFATNKKYSEGKKDDDDDEKTTQIYKLFYAELMKLFVIESGNLKSANANEPELDQKLLTAASEYYSMYNDLYELESDNDTESDESAYLNIPEYTVDEIQAHTDLVVETNNGTAVPIWKRYLEGVFKISDVTLDYGTDKILVSDLDLKYMALLAALLSNMPPAKIELYIWVQVVEVMAAHTTNELRLLFQRSYEEIHSHGRSNSIPRSLQCASAVNDLMGMAVSYAIADSHFFNVTKPKVQTMLHEIKNALAHLVGQAKWMDDNTKLATYQKIIQMKTLIGFPDWFLEDGRLEEYYAGIDIKTDAHLKNMVIIIQVKIKKALNKFREGNNFTWATDPTEVNAYHTFQENTISRKFDKNGNFLPWWSNETVESFVNMTQCFVDQYSTFELPELGEHVDGKKTLGENIADNGGVREALAALKHHLHKHGPEAKLPGFEHMTSEQLFFLSYGNLWCGISTKDSLKADLEDEHSPQQFRAKGALQNNKEFAHAFRCPPGSPMNPRTRCIIF